MPCVLLLTTYPIQQPVAGGQERSRQLKLTYERLGFEVISVAVYDEDSYSGKELGSHDIPIPSNTSLRMINGYNYWPWTDYLSNEYVFSKPKILYKIKQLCESHSVDIIHLEQPWLLNVALYLKKDSSREIKLIYSSQNIEWRLKKTILNQIFPECANINSELIELVKKVEFEALEKADCVITVTEEDAKEYRKVKRNQQIVVIKNGVREFTATPTEIEEVKQKYQINKWCLYVASAHQPNIDGYQYCLGNGLGYIPPDSQLIVAGQVSTYLQEYLYQNSRWSVLNQNRSQLLGTISEPDLNALLMGAHSIIVPIISGEGSNLKTAEALYSNKHVVATQKSFRGYENFSKLSGISITDDPMKFREFVRESMLMPPLQRTTNDTQCLFELTWKATTQPLSKVLKDMKLI